MKEATGKLIIAAWCLFLPAFFGEKALAAPGDAAAEAGKDLTELGLEELMKIEVATVYGASKYEQKVTEAPSSVSIITADDIKKYGYRTLADALRSVRGFYVNYDRNYSYLGARGFYRPGDYNSRVLLLIDGHRMNDNIYDAALIGTEFPLDVDLIDKIEVIRGPGSSLYGSNAFFAVINVITKKGRDFSGGEIAAAAGSLATYNGRISAGGRFGNGGEALLSGSVMDSKGNRRLYYPEFDSPGTNNGIAENKDSDRNHQFLAKIAFKEFTLEGLFGSRTKAIPTGSYGTVFNDDRNRTIDDVGFLDLKYEKELGDRARVMARVFYNRYEFDGAYVYDYPPVTVSKARDWGEWWGGDVQVSATALNNNKLIAGLAYEDNLRQDQAAYDEDPFASYLDDNKTSQKWAAYVQDEYALSKNILINAGVRHDHYDTFGGATNPRLAIVYSPLDKTTLKLLSGTAFRAPNIYELYYQDGITLKPNPDLQPEKITTYEVVLEHYFGEAVRMSAAGFQYETRNLITFQTDPADNMLVFRNSDKISAQGLELELEGRRRNGGQCRISYSYQAVKDEATHAVIVNSPRQLAKFNLTSPVAGRSVFVGLEEQYTGKRKTLAGNYADGFFLTNATVFARLPARKLELSAGVYNLFGKKYGDPGSPEHLQDVIEQDGRTFRVKAAYRF